MPFPRIENLSKIINVESFFTKNLPEIAQKWSKKSLLKSQETKTEQSRPLIK